MTAVFSIVESHRAARISRSLQCLFLDRTHSAAADTAVASLQTVNGNLGDVSISITNMANLRQALQDFVDDVDASKIEATESSVGAVETRTERIQSDIASVTSVLRTFSDTYYEKYPCIDELKTRMQDIDSTILGCALFVEQSLPFAATFQ